MAITWLHRRTLAFGISALGIACLAMLWPAHSPAQTARPNFHPCNSQPSLPICQYGEGRRIAAARWGAPPEPVDPDSLPSASIKPGAKPLDISALQASSVHVQDLATGEILLAKDNDAARPIASITKLMTALVLLEGKQPLDEKLQITAADDGAFPSDMTPRLPNGIKVSRDDLLHLALMASENRAAHALARYYPGGLPAFVDAMNAKAKALGMDSTHFVEPTGLSAENVSSPRDLVRLMQAAAAQPLIKKYSSDDRYQVTLGKQARAFSNTNPLTRRANWNITLSKTGSTSHAGACLVMMTHIEGRDLAIVLLDSRGRRQSRIGDAVRMRRILHNQLAQS